MIFCLSRPSAATAREVQSKSEAVDEPCVT
jgi:hypothetical protein